MASVWIKTRRTANGDKRYRVEFRLGGRESRTRYGGTFKTMREASLRKGWIAGELSALRVPDLSLFAPEQQTAPTLAEAAEAWRVSRVDVVHQTGNMHRSALGRISEHVPRLWRSELTP